MVCERLHGDTLCQVFSHFFIRRFGLFLFSVPLFGWRSQNQQHKCQASTASVPAPTRLLIVFRYFFFLFLRDIINDLLHLT